MQAASGSTSAAYRRLPDDGGGHHHLRPAGALEGVLASIDRWFEVSKRGSSIAAEVRGGVAGWMTTSYILVVNPAVLYVASGSSGIGIAPLVTATAVSSALGSLLVGLTTNMPFALVPGMGLNAYFTFGICKALGVSYQQALSCSLAGGLALLVLAALGACDVLVRWLLSDHLKKAITAAIGMFQAFIGFQAMGLVVRSRDTLVTVGDLMPAPASAHLYLALFGLLLIAGLLIGAEMRGSMLVGVLCMAAVAWAAGLDPAPQTLFAAPSWDALLQVDFSGWRPGSPELPGLACGAAVLFFVCLFDVAGVQHGLQSTAGIPMGDRRSQRVIGVAAMATAAGAAMGTSPVIVATESSAAIMEGARTGLAAVVMSALFMASAVIAPVICAVPRVVTAVPLVVVGAFMMAPARGIAWDDLRVALPAFLTVTVVPFTYSIHNGIIAGLVVDLYLGGIARVSRACSRRRGDLAEALHSPKFHSPAAAGTARVHQESEQAELLRLRQILAELLAERTADGKARGDQAAAVALSDSTATAEGGSLVATSCSASASECHTPTTLAPV